MRHAAALALLMLVTVVSPARGDTVVGGPSGGAPPCTDAHPCSLDAAFTTACATAGNTILLQPGDYGSNDAPLHAMPACSKQVTLRGSDPLHRPRIFTDASTTTQGAVVGLRVDGAGSVVSDLEIHNVASTEGAQALVVFGEGSTISHVVATTAGLVHFGAGGLGFALQVPATATLTDSVAIASNPQVGLVNNTAGAEPLRVQGSGAAGTGKVENVTVVQDSNSAAAPIDLRGLTGSSATTFTNVLIVGNAPLASSLGGATITGTVRASAGPHPPQSLDANSSWDLSAGTFLTGDAALVDALGGDVRQKPGSALTIDHGESASTSTDVDGDVRTLGGAPDIGADEIPVLPTPVVVSIDGITATSAVVHATVDPGGGPTHYQVDFGAGAFDHHIDGATPLTRGGGAQAVTFALDGLAQSTTFQVRVSATNDRGTVTSDAKSFATAGAPTPVPPTTTTTTTTTTPATPTTTPPATTLLKKPTLKPVSKGRVPVTLTNALGEAVSATARLDRLSTSPKAQLKANGRAVVRLKLTRSALKKLRKAKGHRLKAKLVVTVRRANGTTTVLRFDVIVRG